MLDDNCKEIVASLNFHWINLYFNAVNIFVSQV